MATRWRPICTLPRDGRTYFWVLLSDEKTVWIGRPSLTGEDVWFDQYGKAMTPKFKPTKWKDLPKP